MSFKWKDDYSCSIAEINKQHKRLLELGGRLVELAMGKQNADYYDRIVDVLEELKAYTVYHFGYEEQLMDTYRYDNADIHKIEHVFFIKKAERIGRKDIEGEQREVIISLISFIADWITNHILQLDKAFGAFLSSKGLC